MPGRRSLLLRAGSFVVLLGALVAAEYPTGDYDDAADAAPDDDPAPADDYNGPSSGGTRTMELRSKVARIAAAEAELSLLRRSSLDPVLQQHAAAQARLSSARRAEGLIWNSPAQRAAVERAQQQLATAARKVEAARSAERGVVLRLKPLYGIVSTHFADEQRESIASTVKTVSKLAYDQAWWSTVFDLGRAESLQDLLLGFVAQFVLMFVVSYPFALVYYCCWVLPWSLFEYSSGWTDAPSIVVAYLAMATLMALPLIALGLGLWGVAKRAPEWQRRAAERRAQQRYR